jgi:uncharacterized protein YrrD
MLCRLEDLFGAAVNATDGEIGKISNFLFDDQSWMIRYLVVDVGSWLRWRLVVISVTAIDAPDWETRTVRARLTKEQVRRSPAVDSQRPVSRQQEIAMREHYGWPAYWNEGVNVELRRPSLPAGREFPVHFGEDPHLRSTNDIIGYKVWDNESEIGRLENFIIDESSWHIGYLDVKTGDWLHFRSMLASTSSVTSVSWAHHRVNLQPARKHY